MARTKPRKIGYVIALACLSPSVWAAPLDVGVVPGSYRFIAQDANGRQIEASAGAPGRIAGAVACPVTLIAQAEVISTSMNGAQGELRVGDGTAPLAQIARPRRDIVESGSLYRFDVLLERPVDASRQKAAAEFDIRYAHGDATHVFRWPVILDLECNPPERKIR